MEPNKAFSERFEASSARDSNEPDAFERAERLPSALGVMVFVALARGGNYVYVLDFLCFKDGFATESFRVCVSVHKVSIVQERHA